MDDMEEHAVARLLNVGFNLAADPIFQRYVSYHVCICVVAFASTELLHQRLDRRVPNIRFNNSLVRKNLLI